MAKRAPDDLTITARDIRFEGHAARWWHGGDAVPTAFYNALSASFPRGERYFIDSIKHFRARCDPRLQQQVDMFIRQESIHSREHAVFNHLAENSGYDLSRIDAYLKRRFAWAHSRSRLEQLASTMALEHFTAILAHELLSNRRHLEGVPEAVQRLWRWHAIEEIEHKAVAYDVFVAVTARYSGLRRWLVRSYVMLITTVLFLHEIAFGVGELLRQDGMKNMRGWLRLMHYVFVRPGILRRVLAGYFAFYRPGFHPWSRDDRDLIRQAEPTIAF